MSWLEISPRPTSFAAHEGAAGATAKHTARHLMQAGGLFAGLGFDIAWPFGAPHMHVMVAPDTWERFTGFAAPTPAQGIAAGAQSIIIPSGMAGRYHVTVACQGWPNDCDSWQIAPCVNGVPIEGAVTGVFSTWSYHLMQVAGVGELVQGDEVDLRILFPSIGWLGWAPLVVLYGAHLSIKRL